MKIHVVFRFQGASVMVIKSQSYSYKISVKSCTIEQNHGVNWSVNQKCLFDLIESLECWKAHLPAVEISRTRDSLQMDNLSGHRSVRGSVVVAAGRGGKEKVAKVGVRLERDYFVNVAVVGAEDSTVLAGSAREDGLSLVLGGHKAIGIGTRIHVGRVRFVVTRDYGKGSDLDGSLEHLHDRILVRMIV